MTQIHASVKEEKVTKVTEIAELACTRASNFPTYDVPYFHVKGKCCQERSNTVRQYLRSKERSEVVFLRKLFVMFGTPEQSCEILIVKHGQCHRNAHQTLSYGML